MRFKNFSASQQNINTTSLFKVVKSRGGSFENGDILKLHFDDDSFCPYFVDVKHEHEDCHCVGWDELEYYKEDKINKFIKSLCSK